MLKFIEYNYSINDKEILKNISFELGDNEHITIYGESGSGKSTVCSRIIHPDKNEKGIINTFKKISFVSQERIIFNNLNIYDNVTLGLKNGRSKKETIKTVETILKSLKLDKNIKLNASKLSGGEKQRIAIARAIYQECDLFIADEPFIGLDSKTKGEIIKTIKDKFKNVAVILVTHDDKLIETFSNKKLHLRNGIQVNDKTN